jgi:Right handed beta helix region
MTLGKNLHKLRRFLEAHPSRFELIALVILSISANPACQPPPPPQTHGATYYVAQNGGSDSNPCTQSQPCQTINGGISKMSGGDTLIIKAGVYPEIFGMNIPSGSQGNPTVLKSETSHGAIIRPDASQQKDLTHGVGILMFEQQNWITIDGFVIDGINLGGTELVTNSSVDKDTNQGSGHISIINNEIMNGRDTYAEGGHNSQGVTVEPASHDWYIAGNHIHHVGANGAYPTSVDSHQSYCMYFTAQNSIIENNEFDHCGGYGIHQYNAYAPSRGSSGNIIRNNSIHDNGVRVRQEGVLLAAGGRNNQFYNNLVYNNGSSGIITGRFGVASSDNIIHHNTIYGNGDFCIRYGSDNLTIRDNICYNNGNNSFSKASGRATIDHNFMDNPQFISPPTDFHLQAGSPAKTAASGGGEVGAYGNRGNPGTGGAGFESPELIQKGKK